MSLRVSWAARVSGDESDLVAEKLWQSCCQLPVRTQLQQHSKPPGNTATLFIIITELESLPLRLPGRVSFP